MKSRLSNEQLQVAYTEAAKPLKVSYWVGLDDARHGWCLYLNYENMIEATLIAGPFDTCEELEGILVRFVGAALSSEA